jgi:quercetin dioxygenase-like cupin family protein
VGAGQEPATVEIARYTPPASSSPLVLTFVDWDALEVRQVAHGLTRPVWDNPAAGFDKVKMHSTTINPGQNTHAPHRHAFEEFCFVKEGEVDLIVNGKRHRMGPGSLGFFASMDAHGIENVGDKPATYFVAIAPSQASRTAKEIAAAEQNVPGMLPSGVFDCEKLPVTATVSGSVTMVCDSPTLTLSRFASQLVTLNAGRTSSADTPQNESAIVFLKSGVFEVTANRAVNRLSAGSFFFAPPETKLVIKNAGTTPAAYLVIQFSPR